MSKTEGFLRFWCARKCPEDCADDSFCYIRPFFRERKNERKSPKTLKTGVFGDFFVFEGTLCGNPAVECQKLVFFCDFGVPESVLTIRFALYGLLQTLSRGEKRWFQTSLKPL